MDLVNQSHPRVLGTSHWPSTQKYYPGRIHLPITLQVFWVTEVFLRRDLTAVFQRAWDHCLSQRDYLLGPVGGLLLARYQPQGSRMQMVNAPIELLYPHPWALSTETPPWTETGNWPATIAGTNRYKQFYPQSTLQINCSKLLKVLPPLGQNMKGPVPL